MTTGTQVPQHQIVAGIGCGSAATTTEIVALIHACLSEAGLPLSALLAIGTHVRKRDAMPLRAAAVQLGVPLRLLDDAELAAGIPHPSAGVAAAIGLPSIAEAVAAAAGPLLLGKRKSAHATCALAVCAPQFGIAHFGRVAGYANSSAAMASSTLATSNAGP